MTHITQKLLSLAFSSAVLMAACLPVHAGSISVTVVDKHGKPVPNAVVALVTKEAGPPKTPLPTSAVINQAKMKFQPLLTIVPVGAKVNFVNNDPWEHHVRGTAAGAAQFMTNDAGGFNMFLDGKSDGKAGKSAEITVAKAGPVQLGCHLHTSMLAHIYVTDSPWTQATNVMGQAMFDDVPDGAAQIKVWYSEQLLDLPPQAVTVGAKPVASTVTLKVAAKRTST
jgi:plastocyanin